MSDVATGLIDQVQSIYLENTELREATGCTSIDEVIDLIHNLESSLASLIADERLRLQQQSQILDSHERFLS